MAKADQIPDDTLPAEGASREVVNPIFAALGIQISDPEVVALRIAQQLAEATTADELLSESETTSWRERCEIPYKIRNVEWADSDLAGGVGFFAIVTAVNLTDGQTEILTTGATGVVIQLAKIMQLQIQDQAIQYVERTTGSGFKVGKLIKAEDPTLPY